MANFFIFLGIVVLVGFFIWIYCDVVRDKKRRQEQRNNSVLSGVANLRKQIEFIDGVLKKYSKEQWQPDWVKNSLDSFSTQLGNLINNLQNGSDGSRPVKDFCDLMENEIDQVEVSVGRVFYACTLREEIQSDLTNSQLLIKKSLMMRSLLADSFTRIETIYPKKVWQESKNEFDGLISIDSLKKELNSIYDLLPKMTFEEMKKISERATMLFEATELLVQTLAELISGCCWVDNILAEEYLHSSCFTPRKFDRSWV